MFVPPGRYTAPGAVGTEMTTAFVRAEAPFQGTFDWHVRPGARSVFYPRSHFVPRRAGALAWPHMKSLLALVPVVVFALASCGTNGTEQSPSGGDATDAAAGPARSCKATCQSAADCASPSQPLLDASHYTCEEGRCAWGGCQSDAECQAAAQTTKAACAVAPGDEIASCVPTCQTAADCAIPGNPLGDAGHFTCNAGKCQWAGCKSTNDCQSALQSSRFVCDKAAGATTPTCMPTCATAADCALPGSKLTDAAHYTCRAGRCQWLGCRSTGECTSELRISNVVCE